MAVELVTSAPGSALHGELAGEEYAYLDAEWILEGAAGPLPALCVSSGSARWDGGPAVPLPAGLAPDRAAELAFAAVAGEAVRALDGTPAESVEVIGEGIVAAVVRRLLPGSRREGAGNGGAPQAIVDTTGDPARIVASTRRLGDLGTLVLAGERLGRPLRIDLYPDVHRRGLRLVGVAPPLADPQVFAGVTEADFNEPPARLAAGDPIPPAAWYRLSSGPPPPTT